MKTHTFTIKKYFKNLKFLNNLSYKIYNINLNENQHITDQDFSYLKDIYSLKIAGSNQITITDKAFQHLKGIHSLDLSRFNQNKITDQENKYLLNVQMLYLL